MAALSFINQLELEDQVDSATSKQQGSVSGKSVASFTSKLSIVHRSDVLNSTLLAQLAAGKDYNWTTQITEWYKKYIHVLGKIGWVVQDFEFEKYEADSQTLQVSKSIVDIVKAILSPSEIQGVKRVLEALRSPQTSHGGMSSIRSPQVPTTMEIFSSFALPWRWIGSGGDGFGIVLFHSNVQRGSLAVVSVQLRQCRPL